MAQVFVGGFLGSPAMNLLEETLDSRGGGCVVKVGEEAIAVRPDEISARPGLAAYLGTKSCSASDRRTSRTLRPIESAVDIRSLHFCDAQPA